MSTLDEITKEKQRIGEVLARVEPQLMRMDEPLEPGPPH
jgi:hypothetical protein